VAALTPGGTRVHFYEGALAAKRGTPHPGVSASRTALRGAGVAGVPEVNGGTLTRGGILLRGGRPSFAPTAASSVSREPCPARSRLC
jgi:hypothetical protein